MIASNEVDGTKSLEVTGVHPVAAMFPLLEETSERFKSLMISIERNGQWDAVVLDSLGRVVDGRNRLRACALLNKEPRFANFSDLELGVNEDGRPVSEDEYAFDKNLARRDLTDDQRVQIYASYEEWLKTAPRGAPKGNTNAAKTIATVSSQLNSAPKSRAPETRKKLAAKAGVSEHKAQQALNVAREAPALAEQVAAGQLTLLEAAKTVAQKRKPRPVPLRGKRAEKMRQDLSAAATSADNTRVMVYARLLTKEIEIQKRLSPQEVEQLHLLIQAINRSIQS